MMEVIVGKHSGFCNGVKHTVEEANKIIDEYKKVYCLGEIVHNERVIVDLENKGMIMINDIKECPPKEKLIIRAHGEKKDVYDYAKKKDIEIIDLTCGKIKVIRKKVEEKKDNHFILIIGKTNHPESIGVKSFAGENSYILESLEQIDECIKSIKESKLEKVYIVSQTTFNSDKFDTIVNELKKKIQLELTIDKTICNATSNRQEETDKLSKKVDAMIIVGGKNSSNTKELEIISKKNCKNVFLIQNYKDLNYNELKSYNKIGLMAGASTPQIVVDEILSQIEINK